MKSGSSLISDFWWLPENVAFDDLVVGIGHHREITDNEDVPPLESWYRSLTPEGNLSNEVKYYPINALTEWRNACNNTNVYRTLKVFERSTGNVTCLGSFLIDIDNGGEDLDDAQSVTKQVVEYLTAQLKLSLDDLRIFFSGRKGFNVEIRPEAIEIKRGLFPDQVKFSSKWLDNIITTMRSANNIQNSTRNVVGAQGTVIDQIYGDRFGYRLKHPYIRLHNSINKWITGDGEAVARSKIEITYKELQGKSATETCFYSEKQARLP